MLKLTDLSRGQRIQTDGYRGTIVEIAEAIPLTAPCPPHRGKPGVLVYFDLPNVCGTYHHVCSCAQESLKDFQHSLNWLPLDILNDYHKQGSVFFGPTFLVSNPLSLQEEGAQRLTSQELTPQIFEAVNEILKNECDTDQAWVNISLNAGGKPSSKVFTLSSPSDEASRPHLIDHQPI